jgi:HEAT repeat protein
MSLKNELDKFWKWANKTPKEYSENRGFGEWECEYLRWTEIYIETNNLIDELNRNIDYEKINKLLEAIAIDNECEMIIDDYEEKFCNLDFLEELVKIGYKFYMSEARWQIAVLIGKIHINKKLSLNNLLQYLNEMAKNDSNEYVRRRTLDVLKNW